MRLFQFGAGFWRGFWAPVSGLKMICTSPALLSLVIVPLAINIALYILFFYYGSNYWNELLLSWSGWIALKLPPFLAKISVWTLKFLGWILMAVVAALTFTIISGIVSAPFNDHLSKIAARLRIKQSGASVTFEEISKPMKAVLFLEMKRMVVLLGGALVALLIGLIPLMQIPAFALGAFLVAFEYLGYPISQRNLKLTGVWFFMVKHPAVSLGMGTFLMLMMALPFTSIVYIPLAVVGGTLLYVDLALINAGKRKKT